MFFISAWIDSRTALPADAAILRSRLGRRFLFLWRDFFRMVRRFTRIALFLSFKVNQRNHRAVDFVIGGAIGAHAQRILAAFPVPHFPFAHVQLWHSAGVMWIKMLHDHERHARARGQITQQVHRSFESAGRATNADDRAERLFGFPFISRIDLVRANCGGTALSLLRSRSRTSTLHSWGHFINNDLQLVRFQAAIPS